MRRLKVASSKTSYRGWPHGTDFVLPARHPNRLRETSRAHMRNEGTPTCFFYAIWHDTLIERSVLTVAKARQRIFLWRKPCRQEEINERNIEAPGEYQQ